MEIIAQTYQNIYSSFPQQKNINAEKWRLKKKEAEKMSIKMAQLSGYKKRAERMAGCAGALQTKSCPDGHHHRVVRAALCRDRACPVCGWRRSRALSARTAAAMEKAGGRYIMISLTLPHILDLKKSVKILCSAAGKMMRSKRLIGVIGGYIRSVEITRGRGWHPHVHILARVEESYFRSALYVHPQEWGALWLEAVEKTDSAAAAEIKKHLGLLAAPLDHPIIDVRAVVDNVGAANEVAKYVTKSNDILALSQKNLKEWLDAVHGARLWTAAGCLADAAPKNDEDLDLLHEGEKEKVEKCPECGAHLQTVDWTWKNGEYKPSGELLWIKKRKNIKIKTE